MNFLRYFKIAMSKLQRYPENLNLVQNVDDTVGVQTRKVFKIDLFCNASYDQEMCMQVTFAEKSQINKNSSENNIFKIYFLHFIPSRCKSDIVILYEGSH